MTLLRFLLFFFSSMYVCVCVHVYGASVCMRLYVCVACVWMCGCVPVSTHVEARTRNQIAFSITFSIETGSPSQEASKLTYHFSYTIVQKALRIQLWLQCYDHQCWGACTAMLSLLPGCWETKLRSEYF